MQIGGKRLNYQVPGPGGRGLEKQRPLLWGEAAYNQGFRSFGLVRAGILQTYEGKCPK